MSLDKLIKSVRMEVAIKHHFDTDYEIDAFFLGLEEAAKDNQAALEKRDKMLRDTVAELCEAKRLLKAAVEDIQALVNAFRDDEPCGTFTYCSECPLHVGHGISCTE